MNYQKIGCALKLWHKEKSDCNFNTVGIQVYIPYLSVFYYIIILFFSVMISRTISFLVYNSHFGNKIECLFNNLLKNSKQ